MPGSFGKPLSGRVTGASEADLQKQNIEGLTANHDKVQSRDVMVWISLYLNGVSSRPCHFGSAGRRYPFNYTVVPSPPPGESLPGD